MKKTTKKRYIVNFIIFTILSVLLLLIGSFVLFSINKDKISSKIILATNNYAQGDIQFNDIQFNPYVQFPKISLSLNDVKYFENDTLLNKSNLPICSLRYIHIAIDILDLFRKKITISKILLENGEFNIVNYSDTASNIKNAIKPINKRINKDSTKRKDIDLLLNQIILNNIEINITDKYNKKTTIFIDDLKSYLFVKSDTIKTSLKSNFIIEEIPTNKIKSITNRKINFNSSISINRKTSNVIIQNGNINIDKIKLGIYGSLDLNNEKYIDINFKGSNSKMNTFELLLKKYKNANSIESGNIHINGSIKGNLKNRMPLIKCWFAIQDLTINTPETDNFIKDFNLNGSFISGTKTDLSDAKLKIDTITSLLPNGYINGYLTIQNLKKPNIDYLLDIKTDVRYFSKALKLNKLDSLSGVISIFSKMHHSSNINNNISYTSITFDKLSFIIPNIMEFNEINGNISGDIDTVCINNLDLLIDNSDLNINGYIYNINSLLDTTKGILSSNLTIQSQLFDLANFLSFKDNVGAGFPYQVTDLYIDLSADTDKKRFKSTPVPDISFNIHKLDCYAHKLLPPVSLKNVKFRLGNIDSDLYLTFKDFDAIFETGTLSGNVIYHEPFLQDPYVQADAIIKNLDIINFFKSKKIDYKKVPGFYLNGDAYCKLSFTKDTNAIFSKVDFKSLKMAYSTDSTDFSTKNLIIKSNYVNYNSYFIKNPLATLTSDIDIKTSSIIYEGKNLNKLNFKIKSNKGKYNIMPYGEIAYVDNISGNISISPFVKPINLGVDLKLKRLDVDKTLGLFLKDSTVAGDIDILLKISTSGTNKKQIKNNLNGDVKILGDNLSIIGFDLDKVLKDINRSQHFNLVDVGAVLLAGPIGLLVTKGADYTRILMNDHTQTTRINRLISNWEINNGNILTKDFAFSSAKNLMAIKGELDLKTDSLNFSVAVVNEDGCSEISQDVKGTVSKPTVGKLVIVKSLISPVTNLVKIESKCEPFYTGKVKYPEIQQNK